MSFGNGGIIACPVAARQFDKLDQVHQPTIIQATAFLFKCVYGLRCDMSVLTDSLTLPRTGRLQMDIHLSADINVGAATAKRRVNAFLATHVGNLLLADEPVLVLAERIVWRVPVDLTAPSMGRLGRVGEVDVDVESGELLLDDAIIEGMSKRANDLVASSTS